jgi:hypothetical protein
MFLDEVVDSMLNALYKVVHSGASGASYRIWVMSWWCEKDVEVYTNTVSRAQTQRWQTVYSPWPKAAIRSAALCLYTTESLCWEQIKYGEHLTPFSSQYEDGDSFLFNAKMSLISHTVDRWDRWIINLKW